MSGKDERLLGLLKDARRQLELERERRTASIAIVGIGCRFPRAASPSAFWQLLRDGVDATCDVPADRWDTRALYDPDPASPGKIYVRRGGFLDRIDGFDPSFFGISPREAQGMDPQQRLLLEVAWEALEDAGIRPDRLQRSATGVWVGLCLDDYARRSVASGDLSRIDPYNALGNTRSVAAGRIAYFLDLEGPAVQVDTSCSSSLVALHQACQSLRLGETELALVGGVNLMSAPEAMVALCKMRALAPDGRCKTFDASADGYARGEGCGLVVLKRLDDALASADRIHAVIRGVASNHDGRSNGLTAPNGLAQEAVIRAALANAGLQPAAVSYVEAHGTGTPLGDPIELLALSRVYGQDRLLGAPLHLGSVKTNFGHLEGAAGIAGLIKVALCLSKRKLPPQLHFREPNPRIPWDRLPLHVVTELMDWAGHAPRYAGLSSFGLSGTNAHAILEEAPAPAKQPALPRRERELVVLSARTHDALNETAGRLLEQLHHQPESELGDLAYGLVTTRANLEQKLAFVVPSREALSTALALAKTGGTPPGGARTAPGRQRGKAAWLFTGQGAQQLGMGRALFAEWPAFHDALGTAFEVLNPFLTRPLEQVMWATAGTADAALLDQTGYTQPALFALGWSLAALWRSWGVEPDLLMGHSIGELTAACVAGVFSLPDAARLVCARGSLMQALPAGGAMLSIAAAEADVVAAVAEHAAHVSLAAINGPLSTVISGELGHVTAIAERFTQRGVRTKRLAVSHAFHSPLMDPMLAEFRKVAESVSFASPVLPIISNLSGKVADGELANAEYWVRHVRQAVRFAEGLQAAAQAKVSTFVEMGPTATLLGLVPACLDDAVVLLPSLRAGRNEPETVLEALGGWVTEQDPPDWAGVFRAGHRRVELPTYPWQRQSYWVEPAPHAQAQPSVASASADLWFKLDWQATRLPTRSPPEGRWLAIALDDPKSARRLVAELRERGAKSESVPLADVSRATQADHVVCVWDAASTGEAALRAANEGLLLVQALLANLFKGRLWWVTHQAVAATAQDDVAPAGAAVWGLGRTLAQEHPELDCTLIDVDRSGRIADTLLCELGARDGESQVAWRAEQRLVARLVRLSAAPSPGAARVQRPGTVLVTGGLGALGSQLARELARLGAPHLLLTSRRGAATPEAEATRASLEALGARVTLAAVDVADRDALARVLRNVPPEFPLRVVIHAAGVLDDGLLLEQTPERFKQVLAPKVMGASNLHQLTEGADLDAFILFSSLAGTLGSAGQGGYASANAFLDALAAQRRKQGLPALSIAWGPWSERGLAAGLQAQFKRRGIGTIAPEQGLALFELARARAEASLVAAPLDLAALTQTFGGTVPPVWRSLIEAPGAAQQPPHPSPSELSRLPIEQRADAVAATVRGEIARVLSLTSPSLVTPHKPLSELGMDSLMAVELRSALGRRTGVHLPTALIATQPTPAVIEQHILEHLGPPPIPAETAGAAAAQRSPLDAPASSTSGTSALPRSQTAQPRIAGDTSALPRSPAAQLEKTSAASNSAAVCEALSPLEAPIARLFCFHDAGGSAAMFLPLCQLAQAGVEVHAISHARRAPASAETAQQYLREAAHYVRHLADRPYVFFGHSLGGLIAWRLAQELVATGPSPCLLAVSGIDPARLNGSLPDSALDAAFADIFAARAREVQNLKQDFSADMRLWGAMPTDSGLPTSLPIPMDAFVGREDQVASSASMRGWSERTSEDFSLTVLPGNHFYLGLDTAQRLLVDALAARIQALLSGVRSSGAASGRTRSTKEFW